MSYVVQVSNIEDAVWSKNPSVNIIDSEWLEKGVFLVTTSKTDFICEVIPRDGPIRFIKVTEIV